MADAKSNELTEPGKRFAAKIKRLARTDDVEVEHLLGAVVVNDPGLIPFLEDMTVTHQWGFRGRIPESRDRMTVLGRWAFYVAEYLRGGPGRMVELALDPEELLLDEEDGLKPGGFPLGVLEFTKTPESADCVLQIAEALCEDLEANREFALKCASTLNILAAFKHPLKLSENQRERARRFLHALLRLDLSEPEAATVYCGLHGVGDSESVRLIASRPPLNHEAWQGVETRSIQTIEKRLRDENSA